MATITFPTDGSIGIGDYSEALEYDVQLTTSRAGRITTRMLPGSRWRAKLTFATTDKNGAIGRQRAEALLTSLRGGANVLALYHPRKQAPLGTARGAPTVAATAAIGANSLTLTGMTDGQTLLRGDLWGLGSQRVMLTADVTVASGQAVITFEPALRASVLSGTVAIWDKPTVNFIPTDPAIWLPYIGSKFGGPIDVELVEV